MRVRRWVSFHGVSLNVEPDLRHFGGIVPCGISERHLGVTSLVDLGLPVTMTDVDMALRQAFEPIFGATRTVSGADFLTIRKQVLQDLPQDFDP